MNMDVIPIWAPFTATIVVMVTAMEAGHRLGGVVRRRSADERESSASAIAGSILGLTAFMLAFTFGIVTDRFDSRKALVREEANAIGTAYLRTDFLPEPDRGKTVELFREYVDARLAAAQSRDLDQAQEAIVESTGSSVNYGAWLSYMPAST